MERVLHFILPPKKKRRYLYEYNTLLELGHHCKFLANPKSGNLCSVCREAINIRLIAMPGHGTAYGKSLWFVHVGTNDRATASCNRKKFRELRDTSFDTSTLNLQL